MRVPGGSLFAGVRVREMPHASSPPASSSWNNSPTNQLGVVPAMRSSVLGRSSTFRPRDSVHPS